MRLRAAAIGMVITFFLSSLASAQSGPYGPDNPKHWIQAAYKAQSERLDAVDHYVERIQGGDVPGLALTGDMDTDGPGGRCLGNCRVYTTVDVPLPDGSTLKKGHLLSPTEVAVLAGAAPSGTDMQVFGLTMGFMQDTLAANADEMLGPWSAIADAAFGDVSSMTTNKVVKDMKNRTFETSERNAPWLNPFRLFGAGAYIFIETGNAVTKAEKSLGESANQALEDAERADRLLANAQLAGLENVDGEPAMRIDFSNMADALGVSTAANMTGPGGVPEEEPSFVPTDGSMWIRPETYVIVQHRVEGMATASGESREFFIEANNSDYRNVPGTDMYEPYKRTMRMGGIMTDEQMAEMEEARKQLQEFETQMASMSPKERQMVERMMGSKMDMMRGLANGGVLEYVEIIDEILVNPDLAKLFAVDTASIDRLDPSGQDLIRLIQTRLLDLGYEPGNTDGVVGTMTTVAISQFQAEQGLPVSGEPSQELADALAAEIARRAGN